MSHSNRLPRIVVVLVVAIAVLAVGLVFVQTHSPVKPRQGLLPTPARSHRHLETGKCVSLNEGDNLHSAIDGTSRTAFCIHAGTYDIGGTPLRPGTGDRLLGDTGTVGPKGAITAQSKLVYTASSPVEGVIEAGAAVSVRWLDISGAKGNPACQPTCGRGISGGESLRVAYTRLHDNEIAGAGGIGSQASFVHVEVDRNGSRFAEGCCSGGIKSVADGLSVTRSYIHDNIGNGLWSDLCSDHLLVANDRIDSNSLSGVRWETSSVCPNANTRSAVIHSNIIQQNNVELVSNIGAIHIRNSQNADVYDNSFGNTGLGNAVAVQVAPGFAVSNTKIHDNTLNGDVIAGCDTVGIACSDNRQ